MRHLVIILMFHLSLSNSVQAALPPSLEIISINKLSKAPKIPKDGVLSNDTVVDILAALIRDGYLDLPSFVMDWTLASQCFKAKALGENAKGVHSGQLFAISYNRSCLQGGAGDWRPLYILKETKKGLSEILNLHYVRESELGREKVSTKELARQTGHKHISPCDPAVAQRHTGYLVGGTSPFGTRKALPVFMEKSILDLPLIYINGGRRGFLVGVHPHDILQILKPGLVSVALE